MGGNRSVFGVCREAVRVRRLRGQVGFASRCAPIGPLATPRDPRARLCPHAGRADASPARPARATPGIEACAAARFSPKADGRARCATAEARRRRRVLHGSALRHVRRNSAARIASGGVWRRGAPRLCDAFPQVRLLMAAASPCATPPAGIPASSRRECGACATREYLGPGPFFQFSDALFRNPLRIKPEP